MGEIGRNIRARRESLAMTQAELAAYIGKSPAAVSQYERGINDPSTQTLRKIATALGTEPSELMDRIARPSWSAEDLQLLGLFKNLGERDKRVLIATARAMLND